MEGNESIQIRVRLSTWQKLNAMKLPGKSFDDVIEKLIVEMKAE